MNTELARQAPQPPALAPIDINELRQTALLLSMSNYFEAKGSSEVAVAQIATKILAGREMGFGPYASANGIHFIQGKLSVGANLMATAVRASKRYDYDVTTLTDDACSIEFFTLATPDGKPRRLGVSSFTAQDAKKAGTKNMGAFPRNMLFARAMSNGVRWFCPDVFASGPVYVPEEFGFSLDAGGRLVDGATGEIKGQDVQDERFMDEDADNAPMSETLRRTLHALGQDLYGDKWDAKRKELVSHVTAGQYRSSNDLTNAQAMKLIEGMGERLREITAREAVEELMAGAASPAPAAEPQLELPGMPQGKQALGLN